MRISHPGPPDPSNTTFDEQNEMFLVQKREPKTVTMTPRDRFGNAVFGSSGINISIKKVRSPYNVQLGFCAFLYNYVLVAGKHK